MKFSQWKMKQNEGMPISDCFILGISLFSLLDLLFRKKKKKKLNFSPIWRNFYWNTFVSRMHYSPSPMALLPLFAFSTRYKWFCFCLVKGFHFRFLLSTILDGSEISISKTRRNRNAIGGLGIHQKYLGAGYVFCQWKNVLLPHRHHQQRIYQNPPLWKHYTIYEVIFCSLNTSNLK